MSSARRISSRKRTYPKFQNTATAIAFKICINIFLEGQLKQESAPGQGMFWRMCRSHLPTLSFSLIINNTFSWARNHSIALEAQETWMKLWACLVTKLLFINLPQACRSQKVIITIITIIIIIIIISPFLDRPYDGPASQICSSSMYVKSNKCYSTGQM